MLQEPQPYLKGWARAILIIPTYLIIGGVFQLLGMYAVGADIEQNMASYTLMQNLIVMVFTLAGTVFTVSLFIHYIDRCSLKQLGFQRQHAGSDSLLGLLLGAAIMSLGFYSLLWMGEIGIAGIHADFLNLLFCFLLFVMVSVSEELLFRGYVLNNLMQSFNKYIALLASSVLFALMHLANPNFGWVELLSLTLAGIVLGLSYVYTKSLWFPIALHFSWNFFQGPIFGFNISGNGFYSLIAQTRMEDNFINGGAFGFEGSLLSLCLSVLAIGFIWWKFKPKTL